MRRLTRVSTGAILLALAWATPRAAGAQPPRGATGGFDPIEAQVVVMSQPGGTDELAITYREPLPDARVQQDYRELAKELRAAPLTPVIDRREFVNSSARVPGMVNWATGVLQLDPVVAALKRFRHIKVLFIFLGKLNVAWPVGDQRRGPVRWSAVMGPQSVTYDIWVDQSHGTPASIPSTGQVTVSWGWILTIAAGSALAAGSVCYLVYRAMKQRVSAAAEPEGQ